MIYKGNDKVQEIKKRYPYIDNEKNQAYNESLTL